MNAIEQDYSYPGPWRLEWEDAPLIMDANSRVVCVLSSGTFSGPYTTSAITSVADRIISCGERK